MGFLILLRFALLCIDFLAWPVLALAIPLFASIRAIETGSMYQMRKLVTYWTLFSLVSLFEYAFVKIIEWIPFWSSIKLVAIFWLVIPRFHGAYYAYQSFVRPLLVVNVQEVIDSLHKLKEKQTREKEIRFLDLAEKYIQENGSEALEKLIATKMELKVPDNSQKDSQVIIEPDEKDVAPAPTQINEPDAAQKYKETLEAHEIRSPEAKQVPHPRLLTTTKTKDIITTKPRETTGSENRQTTSDPLKKVEPEIEWYCTLCQVTCPCESNFNDHLRGKKHKFKSESLKLSRLDTGSSSKAKPSPWAGKNQVWRRITEKVS